RVVWDGRRVTGLTRDGDYEAIVEVDDEVASASFGVPFTIDTIAPRVRILPGAGLTISVSEPATLTLVVDGRSLRRQVVRAGAVRIPVSGPARRVRVVAWDAAGNVSVPALRVLRA